MRLFAFGLGYSARHFISRFGARFSAIAGTLRSDDSHAGLIGVEVFRFPDEANERPLLARATASDVLLISAPPAAGVDPVLAAFADALAGSRCQVVYLSSVGVYGDHRGAWVDERTPPSPNLQRTQARLAAEQAWARAVPGRVAILRLAGIYGPGRNALAALRAGTARRIIKPGQVFNRVHVEDIGAAIMAAIERGGAGTWNVCDDEPAPPQDVIAYAAQLACLLLPAEEPFETATMSAMARSFYAGNARVSNARLKAELGVSLRYPNYRLGLEALSAGEAAGP